MTRGGVLGPCWAASCCAAWQVRERGGKYLGQTRPGEKEMDFFLYTLFYFLFSELLHYFEFTQGSKPV
jgi:hypothetical protein